MSLKPLVFETLNMHYFDYHTRNLPNLMSSLEM